jgi:hypothetical protein
MEGKMVPIPCNVKDKEFQYNFLKICRYLNLLKNQDSFIGNKKKLVTKFNIYIEYEKNKCYIH